MELLNATYSFLPDDKYQTGDDFSVPPGYSSIQVHMAASGPCPSGYFNRTALRLADPTGLVSHIHVLGTSNFSGPYSCEHGTTDRRWESNHSLATSQGRWEARPTGNFTGSLHVVVSAIDAPGPLNDPEAPQNRPALKRLDFQANPLRMVRDIEANGTIHLHVGDQGVQLARVEASFLFGNRTPTVVYLDDDGNVIETREISARNFHGYLMARPDAMVTLTIDSNGFYGTVIGDSTTYDFFPMSDEAPENGTDPWMRVEWEPSATGDERVDGLLRGVLGFVELVLSPPNLFAHEKWTAQTQKSIKKSCSNTSPSRATSGDGCVETVRRSGSTCNDPKAWADVDPYADFTFRTARSDWTPRTNSAYNAQAAMWPCFTGIAQLAWTIGAPAADYSSSTDCGTHLAAFKAAMTSSTTVDAFQLFTGVNIIGSCLGQAYSSPKGPGYREPDPAASILLAVDTSTSDTYDPAKPSHVGALSAQEIAHNWGEPDHPLDQDSLGQFNVMAGGGNRDWNRIGFWFTQGSQARIKRAWGI